MRLATASLTISKDAAVVSSQAVVNNWLSNHCMAHTVVMSTSNRNNIWEASDIIVVWLFSL